MPFEQLALRGGGGGGGGEDCYHLPLYIIPINEMKNTWVFMLRKPILVIKDQSGLLTYAKLIVLSWCSFNKSWGIARCKGIQDSLGFRIPRNGFRILGSGFRILGQWNLDSGFQSLEGFQIPWDVYSVFQSLGLRIIQQKSAGFRILQAKISLVPESGIPYWVER